MMRGVTRGTHLLSAGLMLLMAVTAGAQTADELAGLMQRSIEDIQVQLRVAPAQAAEDLERQKEQLDALRRMAPEHPMLLSLERRVEELDAEIADAREGTAAAAGDDVVVPMNAPPEARDKLRDVEALQTRADRELMGGNRESAARYMDEAEALIASIAEEYGDRIPPGYARMIVAEERLAALRDQLDRPSGDE